MSLSTYYLSPVYIKYLKILKLKFHIFVNKTHTHPFLNQRGDEHPKVRLSPHPTRSAELQKCCLETGAKYTWILEKADVTPEFEVMTDARLSTGRV